MSEIHILPDYHQPRNEECPHNTDASTACNCKRVRNRKPYRCFRVTDPTAPHRVSKTLEIRVWPEGLVAVREVGRRVRSAQETTVASIYTRGLMLAAQRATLERGRAKLAAKRERKAKRKLAKKFHSTE